MRGQTKKMPRTGKEEERRRKKNHRHQMRKNTKSERDIHYYHRAISLLPLLLLSLVFLSFFSCPTNRMTSASFCFFFSAVAVVAFKLISILVRMLLVLLPTNSVSQSVSLTVIFHLSSFFFVLGFLCPLGCLSVPLRFVESFHYFDSICFIPPRSRFKLAIPVSFSFFHYSHLIGLYPVDLLRHHTY